MRTVTHARKYYNVGGRNFSVENLICNLDSPKLYDLLERALPYASGYAKITKYESRFPLFYNTANKRFIRKTLVISNRNDLDGAQEDEFNFKNQLSAK